jgi:RNA polymerase sigma-70 factor (ECF subfamily)
MVTDAHAMSLETTAVSDGELVSRAITGREESFEELVRRYQRPIVAYLCRLIGDYEAALDLTQDVFIKIHKSLDRYSSDFQNRP